MIQNLQTYPIDDKFGIIKDRSFDCLNPIEIDCLLGVDIQRLSDINILYKLKIKEHLIKIFD